MINITLKSSQVLERPWKSFNVRFLAYCIKPKVELYEVYDYFKRVFVKNESSNREFKMISRNLTQTYRYRFWEWSWFSASMTIFRINRFVIIIYFSEKRLISWPKTGSSTLFKAFFSTWEDFRAYKYSCNKVENNHLKYSSCYIQLLCENYFYFWCLKTEKN